MRIRIVGLAALALLAGCGKKMDTGESTTAATTESAQSAPAAAVGARIAQAVAYVFAQNFRLPGSALGQVQAAHEDACERLGPAACIVLGSTLEGRDGEFGEGTLDVLVASEAARPLSRSFARIVADAKGNMIRSSVQGEVLDGAIAGTADGIAVARARRTDAQSALAAAHGTAARLDAASQTDAARAGEANLAAGARALHARVATSRISVRYESDLPIPTERGRPFALAWARAAENLSEGAALVLTVLVTLAPFALAGIAIAVAWRWLRRRFDWTQARDAMS